ncbi:unnamed protein product, partial [marine sediment metagenome]
FRRDIFLYVMNNPGATPSEVAKALNSPPQSISRALAALNGFIRNKPNPKGQGKGRTKQLMVSVKPVFDLIFEQMGNKKGLEPFEVENIDKVFFHPMVLKKTRANFKTKGDSSSLVMNIMLTLKGLNIIRNSRNREDIQLYKQFEFIVEKHVGKKLKDIMGF